MLTSYPTFRDDRIRQNGCNENDGPMGHLAVLSIGRLGMKTAATPKVRTAATLVQLRTPTSECFREERASHQSCTGTSHKRQHIRRQRGQRRPDPQLQEVPAWHVPPTRGEPRVGCQRPSGNHTFVSKNDVFVQRDGGSVFAGLERSDRRAQCSPNDLATC